jgi:uncharacterized membrane protein
LIVRKIRIDKVAPSHGWVWIGHGYRLIMRSPLHAISLSMVFATGLMVAMMVPLGGVFLAVLVMPVLMAGYMRVCRALEYSEKVEPAYIFAGITSRAAALLSLGSMVLLGMVMISMFTVAMGGSELNTLVTNFQTDRDVMHLLDALLAPESGLRLTVLMSFGLFFILMLAMQFAPMLVFFDRMAPLAALHVSLRASIRNILPFSVYSLIMQGITFLLGMVPFDLGFIFLLPLMLTSVYVAYRDIFNEVKADEQGLLAGQ